MLAGCAQKVNDYIASMSWNAETAPMFVVFAALDRYRAIHGIPSYEGLKWDYKGEKHRIEVLKQGLGANDLVMVSKEGLPATIFVVTSRGKCKPAITGEHPDDPPANQICNDPTHCHAASSCAGPDSKDNPDAPAESWRDREPLL